MPEINSWPGRREETRTKSWAQQKRREKKQRGLKRYSYAVFIRIYFYALHNLKSALVNVTMKNITLAPLVDYHQQLFHPSSECM